MDDIKTIVKEQMDVLNAIPKRNIGVAREKLQAISQVPVMSAFFDFDYCGDPHGIFGSCPFERLHAWLSGTMKDGMQYLFSFATFLKSSRIGVMIGTILRALSLSYLSPILITKLTRQSLRQSFAS
jgi:hypothetical protein